MCLLIQHCALDNLIQEGYIQKNAYNLLEEPVRIMDAILMVLKKLPEELICLDQETKETVKGSLQLNGSSMAKIQVYPLEKAKVTTHDILVIKTGLLTAKVIGVIHAPT